MYSHSLICSKNGIYALTMKTSQNVYEGEKCEFESKGLTIVKNVITVSFVVTIFIGFALYTSLI